MCLETFSTTYHICDMKYIFIIFRSYNIKEIELGALWLLTKCMAASWKNVCLRWVNCLELRPVEEIASLIDGMTEYSSIYTF